MGSGLRLRGAFCSHVWVVVLASRQLGAGGASAPVIGRRRPRKEAARGAHMQAQTLGEQQALARRAAHNVI